MEPRISNSDESGGELHFRLSGVDVSIANAIRRTLISDIPTICFDTRLKDDSTNGCAIKINTSRRNNEEIKRTLACVPIHATQLDVIPAQLAMCELYLHVENTTTDVITVTTADFKIRDKKHTDTFMPEDNVRQLFPPFRIGDYQGFIPIVQLKPRLSDTIPGEQLQLTCDFMVSKARINSSYAVASKVSFGHTVDKKASDAALEARVAQWKAEGKLDATEIEFESRNWPLLDGKRSCVKNSFEFKVKTIGVFRNFTLVRKSCKMLIYKLKSIETALTSGRIVIRPTENKTAYCFDVALTGENHTIGCILNDIILQDGYVPNSPESLLTYVGFSRKHPHNLESILTVAFRESADNSTVQMVVIAAIAKATAVFERILTQCPPQPDEITNEIYLFDEIAARTQIAIMTENGNRLQPETKTREIAKHVAIIVPFRDLYPEQRRGEQLARFVKEFEQLIETHGGATDFAVFIINQDDDIYKFNRGKLLNIGFVEATRFAAKEGFGHYDVYIMHDVDLIPSPGLFKDYSLMPTQGPIHFANVWNRYNAADNYFGGITSFSYEQFTKINGYSNSKGVGWGGEDDISYNRVRALGYIVEKIRPTVDKSVEDLENMTLTEKLAMLRSRPEWKNARKTEGIKKDRDNWQTDGLSNLEYKLNTPLMLGPHTDQLNVEIGLNNDPEFDKYALIEEVPSSPPRQGVNPLEHVPEMELAIGAPPAKDATETEKSEYARKRAEYLAEPQPLPNEVTEAYLKAREEYAAAGP